MFFMTRGGDTDRESGNDSILRQGTPFMSIISLFGEKTFTSIRYAFLSTVVHKTSLPFLRSSLDSHNL